MILNKIMFEYSSHSLLWTKGTPDSFGEFIIYFLVVVLAIIVGVVQNLEKDNREVSKNSKILGITATEYRNQRADKQRRKSARNISKAQRMAILNRDNHQCVYCGSTQNLHIDHIWPVSKGGHKKIRRGVKKI